MKSSQKHSAQPVFDNRINAAAWHSVGQGGRLAIATGNGSARIFDFRGPLQQLVDQARRAVPHELDIAERFQLGIGGENAARCIRRGLLGTLKQAAADNFRKVGRLLGRTPSAP